MKRYGAAFGYGLIEMYPFAISLILVNFCQNTLGLSQLSSYMLGGFIFFSPLVYGERGENYLEKKLQPWSSILLIPILIGSFLSLFSLIYYNYNEQIFTKQSGVQFGGFFTGMAVYRLYRMLKGLLRKK